MKRKRYLLVTLCVIACAMTACITVYVQKDNTDSSITTSDTSKTSADSASVDINIPSDILK